MKNAMKTELKFQAKRSDAGNWFVCKDGRTFCEITHICGDPELNAHLVAKQLNEHTALVAVAEAAANLAHECVPNSDKNMPRLREFWAAQATLHALRNEQSPTAS